MFRVGLFSLIKSISYSRHSNFPRCFFRMANYSVLFSCVLLKFTKQMAQRVICMVTSFERNNQIRVLLTFSKVTLKPNQSFTGHQLHLSQLLSETVKKKAVCRPSVLVPSHSLQQALGPIPHSVDVCQSTQ